MSENSLTNTTPQFGTTEYAEKPGTDRCKSCNQTIAGRYYRVNGAMTCESCAEEAKRKLPRDSHQAYMRGLLFGVGAAILGLALYAAFGIITGWMIGYVSLAVGYIVGKAIKMGSKGMGGRRYQVAAALLTYAAVSMAAIPISISQIIKEEQEHKQTQVQQPQSGRTQSEQAAQTGGAAAPQQGQPSTKPEMSPGAALGWLALVGLASPFLGLQDPIRGAIGLLILFVGVRIAWRIAAGTQVEIFGPFNNPAPGSGRTDAG